MNELSNRCAIIVCPKRPFVEWAMHYKESDTDGGYDERLTESRVYLIEWVDKDQFEEFLSRSYVEVFEHELFMCNSIEGEWPCNRSFELFVEWFDVKNCNEIYDLEVDQIEIEES
jgi:hypothetical protein